MSVEPGASWGCCWPGGCGLLLFPQHEILQRGSQGRPGNRGFRVQGESQAGSDRNLSSATHLLCNPDPIA